jgi:chorismate synthase
MCRTTVFCPSADVSLENYMDALRKAGDSCGAGSACWPLACRSAGQALFDKLDADIAFAMVGHQCGQGRGDWRRFWRGNPARRHDPTFALTPEGFLSNNAGGVLGGISTRRDLDVSIAIKPTSSIRTAPVVIFDSSPAGVVTKNRHDLCRAFAPRRLRICGAGRHGACLAPTRSTTCRSPPDIMRRTPDSSWTVLSMPGSGVGLQR